MCESVCVFLENNVLAKFTADVNHFLELVRSVGLTAPYCSWILYVGLLKALTKKLIS